MLKVRISDKDVSEVPIVETLRGKLRMKIYINDPKGLVDYEELAPGSTLKWVFWYDEIHYVTQGKARITYSLPPLHMERKEMIVEPRDLYLIPAGADLKHEVLSDEPHRRICVVMPNLPEFLNLNIK